MRDSLKPLRDVLANPALRRLQVAWAASMAGSLAFLIPLAVVSYHGGGGATGVGIVMLLRTAACAVFAPFTSILADRASPRRVMMVADLARAALILVLALVVHAGTGIGAVYVLAVCVSIVSTVFRPAQAALMPALARTPEELTASNAVAVTIESAAIFAGPGIGGLMLAVSGADLAFAVCAGLLVLSAILVALVPEPAGAPEPAAAEPAGEGVIRAATAGFRELASTPLLATVVGVYALQALVAGALGVFTVVLALQVLHIGNAGVGYLDSVFGIGGIVGGVGAAALAGGRRLALAFAGGVLVWGIGIALVGISSSTALVCVLLAGVGVGNTVVDVAAITLLQRSAPADVLGRVFGVLEAVMLTALGAGSILAPALMSLLGVRPAIVVTGLTLPVAVALTGRWLVQLDALAPEQRAHVQLLRQLTVFAPLSLPAIEQLAAHVERVEVPEGTVVVREGDPGDQFYIVEEGALAVTVGGQARTPILPGGFFGEIALLRETPRTATVTATADCRLLTVEREHFLAAVTGHAESAAAADLVVSRRLAALRPAVTSV
ncbi:MAG TPA: MFS transporter [Gaiellales bacterium]|nr:MFS transporter [Gaiellales bacterium]